jgi:uncharacterized membrane protein YqjE
MMMPEVSPMATRDTTHPITSLLTRVGSEIAYLLQTEIRLAKTELGEKLGRIAGAGMRIGAGAVLALAGLIVLLLAIVQWLAVAGLPYEWGLLIVGGIVVIVGAALLMSGSRNMKGSALVPQRTIDQLKADLSIMKDQ